MESQQLIKTDWRRRGLLLLKTAHDFSVCWRHKQGCLSICVQTHCNSVAVLSAAHFPRKACAAQCRMLRQCWLHWKKPCASCCFWTEEGHASCQDVFWQARLNSACCARSHGQQLYVYWLAKMSVWTSSLHYPCGPYIYIYIHTLTHTHKFSLPSHLWTDKNMVQLAGQAFFFPLSPFTCFKC